MSKRTCPTPWRYAPAGDSDGEVIGTDHFVLDADDNEVACPPTEEAARLIAVAPRLLKACEGLLKGVDDYWESTPEGAKIVADAQETIAEARQADEVALIVASPDLLEVAEEYEKELTHIERVLSIALDDDPELTKARRKLARVRDVLRKAKAKGEQ